jgi:hypothetical protein
MPPRRTGRVARSLDARLLRQGELHQPVELRADDGASVNVPAGSYAIVATATVSTIPVSDSETFVGPTTIGLSCDTFDGTGRRAIWARSR